MISENKRIEIEEIEIKLLLEAIKEICGHDYSDYSMAHIKRRLLRRMELSKLPNISRMTELLLHEEDFLNIVLKDLSINVSEMFRFPAFYKEMREKVIPILKTYPSIKIWHAGCSTGEEVYSMAILLKEEGLLERTQIFATDINSDVLEIAKEGIYPLMEVRKWTENYQNAGGKNSFTEYYSAKYDYAIFDRDLINNVKFFDHNLATDASFIEANLIICRNVIIYFNKKLQERVFNLFHESLISGGILGLGSKENLKTSEVFSKFEAENGKLKIYKKKAE